MPRIVLASQSCWSANIRISEPKLYEAQQGGVPCWSPGRNRLCSGEWFSIRGEWATQIVEVVEKRSERRSSRPAFAMHRAASALTSTSKVLAGPRNGVR